ncbi:MAG: acyl-CoA dehydratase activase [Candidatus Glassbacteria bacterium]
MAYVGFDIGSISLKLAVLFEQTEREYYEKLINGCPEYFFSSGQAQSGREEPLIAVSRYRRAMGEPIKALDLLLTELFRLFPVSKVQGFRGTGSGGRLAARLLGVKYENEFLAITRGIATLHPDVLTVFEMGGENSKLINLEKDEKGFINIQDYSTNGDCAAGTGSFMDQQAKRMGYDIEDVGDIVMDASKASKIAGRCSVFAKSDMIHVQQKGDQPPEILKGLCEAVVRNFKASIAKGKKVSPRVAILGGVAKNKGVMNAMKETFGLSDEEFFIPTYYAWIGAIGAAKIAMDEDERIGSLDSGSLQSYLEERVVDFDTSEPLSLENVILLRDRIPPYELDCQDEPIKAFLGIDIGSVSTNLALIDEDDNLIKGIYLKTDGRPIQAVGRGLQEIKEELGDRVRIMGVGTTGSGRELIGKLVGADSINDEITAHKTGALHMGRKYLDLEVDTIFDIGGQDSKYISLEGGVVVDFHMNEACAAGTGSFLEEQAEKLGVNIIGEFQEIALSSRAPIHMGERCTVFMEKDVNVCLQQGAKRRDVVAGLAYSIVYNYLNRVVKGRKIGDVIFFQGGTAYNDSAAAAFGVVLGKEGKKIIVPPYSGILGAYGEALLAKELVQFTGKETGFRGYDVEEIDYSIKEITCKACSNFCDVQIFQVEDEKTYWGDKCSYKFRKAAKVEKKPVIPDLFKLREELLIGEWERDPGNGPRVGIGRSMYFFDRFPFWYTFLKELGFAIVLSDATNKKIKRAGLEACVADPCYPKKIAHGHIKDLLDKGVDYILSPNIIDAETNDHRTESYLCIWGQSLPFILNHVPVYKPIRDMFIIPTVHFRGPRDYVKKELREMIKKYKLGRDRLARCDEAVEKAFNAQDDFRRQVVEAGLRALDVLEKKGEQGIVFVGRSYNIYDKEVSLNVPQKLREEYGVNVIPMDFLPIDGIDISDINSNMFWNYGRKILAASRFVSMKPYLQIIYFTNFKCGPDSFIKHFAPVATNKPYLTLQLDEHGADAGTMTRVEAYLDSKGLLRWWSQERTA